MRGRVLMRGRHVWFFAFLLSFMTLLACSSESPSGSSSDETPASVSAGPPLTTTGQHDAVALQPLEKFSMGLPQGLVIDFGSVWTTNETSNTVTRIDPGSGH